MMDAGIHKLPMAVYQADPAPEPSLSSGIANTLITRCAFAAWWAHPRLGRHPTEANNAMDLGSYAHACLLEGGTDKLAIVDADDWRTKAARETRDVARAEGKLPILAARVEEVTEMVAAARAYIEGCELPDLLHGGYAEHSLLWRNDDTWCRARPDWMSDDYAVMVDYKTTTCAEPGYWTRQLVSMGYDLQASLYSDGCHSLTKRRPNWRVRWTCGTSALPLIGGLRTRRG